MARPKLPPSPSGLPYQTWAQRIYEYLISQSGISGKTEPAPVQLPHVMASDMPRATTDGLMLFDPATGKVLVSVAGVWKSVTFDP